MQGYENLANEKRDYIAKYFHQLDGGGGGNSAKTEDITHTHTRVLSSFMNYISIRSMFALLMFNPGSHFFNKLIKSC